MNENIIQIYLIINLIINIFPNLIFFLVLTINSFNNLLQGSSRIYYCIVIVIEIAIRLNRFHQYCELYYTKLASNH